MTQQLLAKTLPPVRFEPEIRDAMTKGERTRERILDLAQEGVIAKGFAATSIEELVEAAGITKSGFFYHFKDKNDLARQLLERFLAQDDHILDQLGERARALSDDPLHSFLIFLKLFAEMMDSLPAVHPGCLVAAITHQERAFDREVTRLVGESVIAWRQRFGLWIAAIAAQYAPRLPVDLQALADHVSATVDGGIVLSRACGDRELIGRQIRLLHDFVRLLFAAA